MNWSEGSNSKIGRSRPPQVSFDLLLISQHFLSFGRHLFLQTLFNGQPIMAPDTLSLAGKVAIITGSGKENGIGAGIAYTLARNGASVVINHVSESSGPRAVEVVRRIEGAGGRAMGVQADVTDPEGAQKLVQEALKGLGVEKIDILGMPCLSCVVSYSASGRQQ